MIIAPVPARPARTCPMLPLRISSSFQPLSSLIQISCASQDGSAKRKQEETEKTQMCAPLLGHSSIHDHMDPRRRVRGPGLPDVVGRLPSRGGTYGVMQKGSGLAERPARVTRSPPFQFAFNRHALNICACGIGHQRGNGWCRSRGHLVTVWKHLALTKYRRREDSRNPDAGRGQTCPANSAKVAKTHGHRSRTPSPFGIQPVTCATWATCASLGVND